MTYYNHKGYYRKFETAGLVTAAARGVGLPGV